MIIPDGYTEQEVVEIITDISKKLSLKFRFGYHEPEDMRQQAALFAWEGLERYNGSHPLENFLWVHVRNRLFNYKRNNFGRPDKPCFNCPLDSYKNNCCEAYINLLNCEFYEKWFTRNASKQNLMRNKEYLDISPSNEREAFITTSNREIIDLIDKELPSSFRKDWVKLQNDIKISKRHKAQMLEVIKDILDKE